MRRHFFLGLLSSLALAAGCSDPTPPPALDAAADVTADVTADVSSDTATDVQSDTATDAQSDAATDAQSDTATDAQSDTATDAAADVATDTAADAATDAQSDGATDGGLAAACTASGGTVSSSLCCLSSGDFPNNCAVGSCSCAPTASHTVMTCQCPSGRCWNGSACVSGG